MPINVPPELIELTDFSRGWLPDFEESAVPVDGLIDSNNLLPDRVSGVLETRPGFRRFGSLNETGYKVKSLHTFNVAQGGTDELGHQFLVAVLVKDTEDDLANNLKIKKVDVSDGSEARVDDAGRPWLSKLGHHFGVTIDNTFFGGGELDPIYSYKPYFADGTTNPDPWDPDATMGQYASTEWATATVYAVGDRRWAEVTYNVVNAEGEEEEVTRKHVFVCTKAHTSSPQTNPKSGKNASEKWENLGRYRALWSNSATYSVGDIVSYEVGSGGPTDLRPKFPRSYGSQNRKSTFVCVRAHTASATKTPVEDVGGWTGSNLWEPRRGPRSSVGLFHGGRLHVRDTDVGTSVWRYSAPVRPDGFWDPTDWESDTVQGAGFFYVPSQEGDDVMAAAELGTKLVIVKRRGVHVLSGLNPSTWRRDQIDSNYGCINKRSICELDGLVYFFGDQGLMMTDGVECKPAPGSENIQEWLRTNLSLTNARRRAITLAPYEGRLFLSVPISSNTPDKVLVYEPNTGTFWPQTFGARQFATNRISRFDELFFGSTTAPALIMQWNKSDANNQDDTGASSYTAQDIPWKARFGWLTFGASREDRQLRRVWGLLRAASKTITLKAFRNLKTGTQWTKAIAVSSDPVNFVEGISDRAQQPDSWAVSYELSGTSAPTSILGLGIHSVYRRKRFHKP